MDHILEQPIACFLRFYLMVFSIDSTKQEGQEVPSVIRKTGGVIDAALGVGVNKTECFGMYSQPLP